MPGQYPKSPAGLLQNLGDDVVCQPIPIGPHLFDCGTHTLFLGRMKDGAILKEGKPMTYDYYHNVKKGTTPPKAPTFIRGESGGLR